MQLTIRDSFDFSQGYSASRNEELMKEIRRTFASGLLLGPTFGLYSNAVLSILNPHEFLEPYLPPDDSDANASWTMVDREGKEYNCAFIIEGDKG